MNDRIKQLAEQAGIYKLELSNDTDYWILDKFAELIVRECAKIGSKAMYPDSDPDYVGRKIKQHFGVEE